MKDEKDMTELFHHCTQVVYHEGIWQPQRFPEKTLQYYEQLDQGKAIRAHSCAGITMEFVTEEEEIGFSYESYGFCRPMVVFDIFENDIFVETIREPDDSLTGRIKYRRQTKGAAKLAIHLPHCVWLGIKELSLGAWEPVAERAQKILFLGDSITQGMTVSCPSQSYPVLTAGYLRCDYINQGVGGYVFCERSLEEIELVWADQVVVAYGTNDYFAVKGGKISLEEFRETVSVYLEELCNMVNQLSIQVITPIWRADCSREEWEIFLLVSGIIREEACRRRLAVVDGLTLVGHQEMLYTDGLHPNDWGANMMALNLLRAFEEGRQGTPKKELAT